jgi:DNA invertase Pin-like site-specific DNA recombinase
MGKIAAYARVSTADQNLDRQLEAIDEYAQRTFDTRDVEYYTDKSTGTDTSRSGYRDLMAAVEAGEIDTVVAHQVSRVARSISDLEATAERFREHDCALHIVREGLQIDPDETDPYQRALFQLLGVFAELEAEIKRSNIREGLAAKQSGEDYHHGPAPLGFEKRDGQLVEGPDFHRVCAVLEDVARGEKSKRQAARDLDVSRRTVQRAVDERAELYGL